jgi:hypothetical protein
MSLNRSLRQNILFLMTTVQRRATFVFDSGQRPKFARTRRRNRSAVENGAIGNW